MYTYNEIKKVHLEMSSRCNAACPQCARNQNGGADNPLLPITDFTLKDAFTLFESKFIKQLDEVLVCGNFGDPIVAPECLDILEYFRIENPSIWLSVFTNGSARTESWWKRMAKIIGQKGQVRFAIDGLSDTNHIYRRRTNFETIMKNAKTYLESGGRAEWDFIIFRHNQHQIDEARQLSNDMGFAEFHVKRTSRFLNSDTLSIISHTPVQDRYGKHEYNLEPPTDVSYINQEIANHQSILDQYGSFDQYFDQCRINCKVGAEKSIYVSAENYIFPCCWTAHTIYTKWGLQKNQIIQMIEDTGGLKNINGKNLTLEEIIHGDFFQSIASSWQKNSIGNGKLKVCARICGERFDAFDKQFEKKHDKK